MAEKVRSISEECKLFKNCPFSWGCVREIERYGFAIWSVQVCYDLKNLVDAGLVKLVKRKRERRRGEGERR